MSAYNHKYNTDNVLVRGAIVALLNFMNNALYIEHRTSDTETSQVKVPFYFSQGGDERFMQDFYTSWFQCNSEIATGLYGQVPRGILNLASLGVNSAALTNKWVYAERVVEEDGSLNRYFSLINSVPLTLSFTVNIEFDSWLDSLKVSQSVLTTFWKAQAFSVFFDGFRIPCQVGFPDDYDVISGKLIEYSYGDVASSKVVQTFPLEMETYLPVLDKSTEFFAGNRIESFVLSTEAVPPGIIDFLTPPPNPGTAGDSPIEPPPEP